MLLTTMIVRSGRLGEQRVPCCSCRVAPRWIDWHWGFDQKDFRFLCSCDRPSESPWPQTVYRIGASSQNTRWAGLAYGLRKTTARQLKGSTAAGECGQDKSSDHGSASLQHVTSSGIPACSAGRFRDAFANPSSGYRSSKATS